jgi:hypothetical protein
MSCLYSESSPVASFPSDIVLKTVKSVPMTSSPNHGAVSDAGAMRIPVLTLSSTLIRLVRGIAPMLWEINATLAVSTYGCLMNQSSADLVLGVRLLNL